MKIYEFKKLYPFHLLIMVFLFYISVSTAGEGDKTNEESMNSEKDTVMNDFMDIPFQTITGENTNLNAFAGKVLLLVNVASECGYTKQYAPLEELYKDYKDSGLVVIGFPANNFGGQEPGTNEEILNFCSSKYNVTFPMMSKISVKGEDKHPLFVYLTEESDIPGEISWNFGKFLIDRNGKLVKRFDTKIDPLSDEIVNEIKKLL